MYSGSLTTPPCLENVYWNVVKKIYPIKKHHMDFYKELMKKASAVQADVNGNYRKERPATADHNVKLIKSKIDYAAMAEVKSDPAADSAANAALAMILLFCITIFIILGLTVYVCVMKD